MALQFQPPPDWLLQEYVNQKNPVVEGLQGVSQVMQQYATQRAQQQKAAVEIKQLALLTDKEAREGRKQFYDEGDVASLPSDIQSQLGQPVQGPPTEAGVAPQVSSLIESYNQHIKQYPQGFKGQERGRNAALQDSEINKNNAMTEMYGRKDTPGSGKPPDMKKTFQLKGFEGNVPVSYDTRTGQMIRGEPTSVPLSPTVAPSIPGTEVSKFGELENLKQKMTVLRQNYKPEFVGMVDAPMQAIKQKTGVGASREGAFFRQTSQDIKDSLLRARSGAQINEQEYQRLLPIVPNETTSEVDFLAKADRFDQVLNEMIASKQGAFQQAGYRTPNFSGGLDPAKKSRLEELRAKRAAGTLR